VVFNSVIAGFIFDVSAAILTADLSIIRRDEDKIKLSCNIVFHDIFNINNSA
jgi:hypothetical protein